MSDSLVPLLRWLAAADPVPLVLACDHSELPAVPRGTLAVHWDACLAQAHIGAPLQLIVCGARRVELVPCEKAPEALDARFSQWQAALGDRIAWYAPSAKHIWRSGQTLQLGNVPLPRRAALGLPIKAPISLTADAQERTAQALTLLSISPAALEKPDSVHLAAAECSACGVCVQACSNNALSIAVAERVDTDAATACQAPHPTDRASTLRHDLAKCRGCRSCVELCPLGTLAVTSSTRWEEVTEAAQEDLARLLTRLCPMCGTRYDEREGQLCALCAYRSDHAFSAIAPENVPSIVAQAHRAALAKAPPEAA